MFGTEKAGFTRLRGFGFIDTLSQSCYNVLRKGAEVKPMNFDAWWGSLDALLRVLYLTAVPSTLLLLVQLILAVVGFSHAGIPDAGDASGLDAGVSHDMNPGVSHDLGAGAPDTDLSGASVHDFTPAPDASDVPVHAPGIDALRLFTLSGIVSFFAVFSWSSILLRTGGVPGAFAVAAGLVPGGAAMYLVAKILQLSGRLTESGNMNLNNAVDLVARVYIPIPGARRGEGKVTLVLQGSFVELGAVTDEPEQIPSGTAVVVVGVAEGVLVVSSDLSEADN
jgi:hypothetical protein